MLGELCGARAVPPAADGLCLHRDLHFSGGVPVEASCRVTSDCDSVAVLQNHPLTTSCPSLQALLRAGAEKEQEAGV